MKNKEKAFIWKKNSAPSNAYLINYILRVQVNSYFLDSDSESSSSEEENLYYSTYDNKFKKGLAAGKIIHETKDTHDFCLTFKVGKGVLTIYAPVRVSYTSKNILILLASKWMN